MRGCLKRFSVFFPPGYAPSAPRPGCQELDRAIVALAAALSQARGQPAGARRKVNTAGQAVSLTLWRLIWCTGTHTRTRGHMHVHTGHSHAHLHIHTHTSNSPHIRATYTYTRPQIHSRVHIHHTHHTHMRAHYTTLTSTRSHTPGPHTRQVPRTRVRNPRRMACARGEPLLHRLCTSPSKKCV